VEDVIMRRSRLLSNLGSLPVGLGCRGLYVIISDSHIMRAHTMPLARSALNNTTCVYCLLELLPIEMHKSTMLSVDLGVPPRTFSFVWTEDQ